MVAGWLPMLSAARPCRHTGIWAAVPAAAARGQGSLSGACWCLTSAEDAQVAWLANGMARLVCALAPWLRRAAEQPLADVLLGFLLPGLLDRWRCRPAWVEPGRDCSCWKLQLAQAVRPVCKDPRQRQLHTAAGKGAARALQMCSAVRCRHAGAAALCASESAPGWGTLLSPE